MPGASEPASGWIACSSALGYLSLAMEAIRVPQKPNEGHEAWALRAIGLAREAAARNGLAVRSVRLRGLCGKARPSTSDVDVLEVVLDTAPLEATQRGRSTGQVG